MFGCAVLYSGFPPVQPRERSARCLPKGPQTCAKDEPHRQTYGAASTQGSSTTSFTTFVLAGPGSIRSFDRSSRMHTHECSLNKCKGSINLKPNAHPCFPNSTFLAMDCNECVTPSMIPATVNTPPTTAHNAMRKRKKGF